MAQIKEKDFIELEYTGKIKEDNLVFDTTNEKIAKENSIYNKDGEYKARVICVGQGQIIEGIDKALIGKEPNKEYTIEIKPEEGYGKKNAKFIQLISTSKFQKQNIQPIPGLQVNIDGMMGVIKTVSGGRTLVDFNHPLAGRDVVYSIKVNKIITDDKEKIDSILKLNLIRDAEIKIEDRIATINLTQEIPKQLEEELKKKIKELLPNIEEISIQKSEKKGEDLNRSNPTTNKPKGGQSGTIH